jgi:two-component system sensor histidine kinase KdpD
MDFRRFLTWKKIRIELLTNSLALAGIALTTGVLVSLRTMINPAIVALLYLLPVSLSTVYGGLGQGIFAALAAFLAFNYFFIEPLYSLMVHRPQDILGLGVFLGVAFALSQAFGTAKRNLTAARAREREAVQLYELSSELAGLQDGRSIVQALARKIMDTFQPERLNIIVEGAVGRDPISLSMGIQYPGMLPQPYFLIPLQTSRGLIGEIHLWRREPSSIIAEERLLKTFASQGVLALERVYLIQADNRARVLEESDRLKTALLSSVSHELRTPLATIKASVTALRSEAEALDQDARDELLAAIEEETDHLNQLVGNLLDMSRIEAGALNPQKEWNVFSDITSSVLYRMRSSMQNHSVVVDIPEELPLVPVDFAQMEQVFTNLLSNSVKYSPLGTQIQILAREQTDHTVLVQVKNQGPPVPQEHLERIFDKFNRVTAADRITGTGLGLSICKGIIQAHGGRIWAENLADGFSYNFTLPLEWEGASPRVPIE